jgi:response regulator NasT
MADIIVAFAKRENAANIRNLLVQNGFQVSTVSTTGASVIRAAIGKGTGIVVCGYKLSDMVATTMLEMLPDGFELLLLSKEDVLGGEVGYRDDRVIRLPMPIKAYDLIDTINMMQTSQMKKMKALREKRRNRSDKETALLNKAKELLMDRNQMSEDEAHRYLQKNSMASGVTILEMAEMVLSIMKE